ncbi:hypothetical protein [Spiroplasma turonicum]|uniref:Uncharacterized protein n=1 Tax=Spiroplasma turonicum TaxID=216946 RepID=A0A0K1P5S4_9MOLU|nr:hypothetical protein [Spiroplasma turonicum]AKU79681.1 hypothetical protein STURON_00435 [Spiroplasma turonicum]ALX70701.1 hypothetical protein STURO_v1c04330 [Spiroplasma turonicum]
MDIKLLEQFVNKKGIYKLFNKAIFKGYICINPNNLSSKDDFLIDLKDYIENVIKEVKNVIKISISVNQLIDMVDLSFYKNDVLSNDIDNEVNKIKIKIKNGMENNINGVNLSGTAMLKIYKKISLNNVFLTKNIQKLSFGLLPSIEVKILNNILKYNENIIEPKKTLKVKEIDKENKNAYISLSDGFNNPYFLEEDIKVYYE